jgi:hypothetical protein
MMRTFEAVATVTSDGKLHLEIPVENLEPGEYQVVLIIEEQPVSTPKREPLPPLRLKPQNWGNIPPEMTFRREDIYEDDDR